MARHFLTGEELTRDELSALLDRALELKAGRASGEGADALAGKSIALVFEKPSTRTRVSFEVGVAELGGTPLILRGDELQLSRGESVGDTARVLSRYVHAIVVRAGSHEVVAELARGAAVPVINGLTPEHHPCQALADLLTLRERFGDLDGLRVAYVGDGNNVARSLALLGRTAGVEVRVASPEGYRIEPGLAALDTGDPREAAAGADAIYTDVWVSMGDEDEAQRRRADLAPFQVNAELLARGLRAGDRPPLPPRPPRRGDHRGASSTASAPPSGTRPRTASTPKRRCSSSWCAEHRGAVGNARRFSQQVVSVSWPRFRGSRYRAAGAAAG